TGSAAAPATRCRKFRRGSFILDLPLASHHSITSSARRAPFREHSGPALSHPWGLTTISAQVPKFLPPGSAPGMPCERFEHRGHAVHGDEIARPVILRKRRVCEIRAISQITPIDVELFKNAVNGSPKASTFFMNCHFR